MTERQYLITSPTVSLIVSLLALGFYIPSDSQAIFLEGAFNLLFCGLGLLTLRVLALVKKPSSREYPYGYASFEPLLNTVKGLLILGVSLMAGVPAIEALLTGGRRIDAEIGLIYGCTATILGLGATLLLLRGSKATQSPLVHVDAQNWIVNTVISAGITVAFVGARVADHLDFKAVLPYVDPLVVTAVVLFTLPIPIKMIQSGVHELLMRGPEPETQAAFSQVIEKTVPAGMMSSIDVRMARVGRQNLVSVCCKVNDADSPIVLSELDQVRDAVFAALRDVDGSVNIEVSFTGSGKWASARVSNLSSD